jgi:hypothetical protein
MNEADTPSEWDRSLPRKIATPILTRCDREARFELNLSIYIEHYRLRSVAMAFSLTSFRVLPERTRLTSRLYCQGCHMLNHLPNPL